jgi:prepilin-type processing-associated H-X9-DG protein
VKLTFADFTDGLSNTLHLTESAGRPNVWQLGKLVVNSSASATGFPRVNGGGWARPGTELDVLRGSSADGTTFPGPAAINVTNGASIAVYPDPFYGVDGSGQIYGFHTGGVNVLFVDGSVHFLQQSVSVRTLAALVSRNGGEVFQTDGF